MKIREDKELIFKDGRLIENDDRQPKRRGPVPDGKWFNDASEFNKSGEVLPTWRHKPERLSDLPMMIDTPAGGEQLRRMREELAIDGTIRLDILCRMWEEGITDSTGLLESLYREFGKKRMPFID